MSSRQVIVLGLGRVGLNVTKYLLGQGDTVIAYDDDPNVAGRETVQALPPNAGLRLVGRAELARVNADLVIASPGIPDDAELVTSLRARGLRVIDELELGFEQVGRKIVAITGTNGKSTTTALIGEMLLADGRDVFYGGNLAPGRPFAAALSEKPKEYYVLEVSSFQLERCERFAPRVGLLLNVAPDHLNRHQSLERYLDIKFALFRNQTADDFAVVNRDDARVFGRAAEIRSSLRTFSLVRPEADACLNDGVLRYHDEAILEARELRLPGRHNIANALAAICAARLLGVGREAIARVLKTFAGLEHRLELVREEQGVRYINSSMTTNPTAAIQVLEAVDGPVVLITGGREKGLPVDDYLKAIAERVGMTILVGENRQKLADGLARLGYARAQTADSLDAAVRMAIESSRPGSTVLFSPGFASFDAYVDFQERGKAFRDAVRRELDRAPVPAAR
jgi:UDP-N-acetylmuramoylalanine--D-glutamate ligase